MTRHALAALALALLLVGGATGVSVATSTQVPNAQFEETDRATDAASDALPDEPAVAAQQGGPGGQVNLSEVNVSAVEAVELVEDRLGGKAVGVRLTRSDGAPAFNVTVLHENLSVAQATVDATAADPTVAAVRRNVTVVQPEFLGGEAFDFADLRSAAEAARLIRNETTGTVVNVGLRRGELVYGVALRSPDGTQTQALVTATSGPVLGIRSVNATAPPTANATTTTGR